MASGRPAGDGGWIASFRGLFEAGKQRRNVRVPRDALAGATDAKAAADAYATDCDRACRQLEIDPTAALIDRALVLRAITDAQADSLRAGLPPPPARDPLAPWTLLEAAQAHPATQREERQSPAEYQRHRRELNAFAAWAGVMHLAQLTLPDVQRYVDHLRKAGRSWDGRRHCLLWLRRAARMAATRGLPDVLGELVLDRATDDDRGAVETWTLPEIARALVTLERAGDVRALVATAVQACVGLRPSEAIRLRCGDVRDGLLAVGQARAKNRSSRRVLPLPATVAAWCKQLAAGRPATAALIGVADPIRSTTTGAWTGSAPGPLPFSPPSFNRWLGHAVACAVTGAAPPRTAVRMAAAIHSAQAKRRTGDIEPPYKLAGKAVPPAPARALPVKALRKTFATWTLRAGIQGQWIEAYLGHSSALVSRVTARHYLDDLEATLLRPAAAAIDDHLRAALAAAAPPV